MAVMKKKINSDVVKAKVNRKFSFGICNSETSRPTSNLVLQNDE